MFIGESVYVSIALHIKFIDGRPLLSVLIVQFYFIVVKGK
jgi:hypothetical protein